MFGIFDTVKYENKLRAIKEKHFDRVNDLENTIHKQKMDYRELEVRHKHDINETENKYKLQVQEITKQHESEITQLKHEVKLEKENWGVKQKKLELEFEKNLNDKKLETEKEVYAKLSQLVEREGKAKDTVVASQLNILDMLKSALPNVNWNKQDGSPVLSIEADINKNQKTKKAKKAKKVK